MKPRAIIAGLVAAAALSAWPAAAQDLAGVWELTSETPRGVQTMTLSLTQEGARLTGTITMSFGGRGGGGGGARDFAIRNGTVEGNTFSFTVELAMGGNSITQTYRGTVADGEMKGEIEGARGTRSFTGKRST